jgi:acetyltransferase-like isoleucine patch superfamily enzyme
MFSSLRQSLALRNFRRQWRLRNAHNATVAEQAFDVSKVSVGNYTYGGLFVVNTNYPNESLSIGHFCSIASDVKFFLAGNHFLDRLTTFPVRRVFLGERQKDGCSKGPITIGSDVWIGTGAWFLSGVTVGQGAVIGAGAVVAKDVPPYAVVVGSPAKVVKYRFSPEIVRLLLEIDYSRLGKAVVLKNIELMTDRSFSEGALRQFIATLRDEKS